MQFDQLKRREFITLFGGTAATWPLAARAQQPALPVVAVLHPASPDTLANRLRGFRQGLKETGFVEDENMVARMLGLTVPDKLLVAADEVIE
jgi:putative ABC transport system substrate-binding protein